MDQTPFFSVIIPTYNRAQFLGIAINSVLAQSCKDFELLVIDDGSTDTTQDLVRQYQDPRLRYVHQGNCGPASARNLGIKKARGSYISFLDSDDRFRADKLKITKEYIGRNPPYRVFHTEEIWYRNGSYLPQKIYHKKPSGYIFENSVTMCSVGISTCTIERGLFDEVGVFDESLPACEDYDFFLRVTAKFPVLLIPEFLTIKEGGHSDQQSTKYPSIDTFRIQALVKVLEAGDLSESRRALVLQALKGKCAIFINGAMKRGKISEAEHYKELLCRIEKAYA